MSAMVGGVEGRKKEGKERKERMTPIRYGTGRDKIAFLRLFYFPDKHPPFFLYNHTQHPQLKRNIVMKEPK